MPDKSNNPFQFWEELKRRKVFRVVAMYAASAFIILELVDIISPALQLPSWTLTLVIVLLAIGFPIVAILSWVFDITPEGLKKTEPARVAKDKDQPESVKRNLRISDLIIVVLVIVVIILAYPRVFKENYLTKLVVFPFTNESNDSSENWLQYGIMDAIWHDLVQFNYILCGSNSYATHLQEQIKLARTNSFPHFLTVISE